MLEAIQTKFFIVLVGYLRDPIGNHQKQIPRGIADALARIAPPGNQAQWKLLHGESRDVLGRGAIGKDGRITRKRIFHFGGAVEVQKRDGRVHIRLLDRRKNAVGTFQYGHRFLSELEGDTHRRLQHSHQLAGGQAVSGNVSHVSEQRSVTLYGIDQVAAHFCAGNGFPVDLEAVNLKRKRRNQSRLYDVCEGPFGLDADGGEAFGPDEIDEQSIPDYRAHQDADGVEDDSTMHRLEVW